MENIKNKEKTEKINQMTTPYCSAFMATVENIIAYMLGEHDPGSAQDWRTSSDLWRPGWRSVPVSSKTTKT